MDMRWEGVLLVLERTMGSEDDLFFRGNKTYLGYLVDHGHQFVEYECLSILCPFQ